LPAALLLSVPTLIFFAALSDRVGRKWMMMAACLLGIVTWFPIYKAMQRAAGNNVVSVGSTKNKVTGAITLSPMTVDPLASQLVPAKEASNPDIPSLILLVFAQLFVFTMIYAPLAAYLVEAFRRASATPRFRFRITSAMAFSAACCRLSASRFVRPPVIFSQAFTILSPFAPSRLSSAACS